jgi:hypothetical protein
MRRELAAQDERMVTERTRELVFEHMLERLPRGAAVRNAGVAAGGNRFARIDVEGSGEVTLVHDGNGRADLRMDRCELEQLETPDGVVAGCDAEAVLGRRFHDAWREAGLEVEADDIDDDIAGARDMAAGS